MNLILASNSKYKQSQLSSLQLNFRSISPEIIENHDTERNAKALAESLAAQKALALSSHTEDSIIIGSDQTASSEMIPLLTKPNNTATTIEQLLQCSDSTVIFHSAVSLLSKNFHLTWSIETKVEFRTLLQSEIERYISKEPALDCAGGFKVEGLGISLFTRIQSDDPSALIGLPLISLSNNLRSNGFQAP